MTKQSSKGSRGTPPTTLSRPARDWWRRITSDFEIHDNAGLILLESTLQAWDRLQEGRAAILRDGVILTAPNGRAQQHPALRLERDARAAMVAGFRALRLDLEPLQAIGRLCRDGMRRSDWEQGREAVMADWKRLGFPYLPLAAYVFDGARLGPLNPAWRHLYRETWHAIAGELAALADA